MFSQPSCQKRLLRALLILEFVTAVVEEKLKEQEKNVAATEETQINTHKLVNF